MATERFLVTGANKGLGLAIVERLLAERPNSEVILCARDVARGEAAREALVAADPTASRSARLRVQQLDVCDPASVAAAAAAVAGPLRGLVLNAGVWGTPAQIFDTNLFGVQRCMAAFRGHVVSGSGSGSGSGSEAAAAGDTSPRVVLMSSGVGPSFVAKCTTAARKGFLVDADGTATWESVAAAADEYLRVLTAAQGGGEDEAAAAVAELAALGYPPASADSAYGASKALLNLYLLVLARTDPAISVNACSPGFVATDMTAPFFVGKSPQEAGAVTPAEGTRSTFALLFGDSLPTRSGGYYGSDGLRSPLDRYRGPGTPAYDPEAEA
jgi:NAD(P)-dependent dehydrogenase (short-subunit alcohol dehydrogenase family)